MLSNKAIIENFIHGVDSNNCNLRVCGNKLINYSTTIAQKIDGVIVVNGTRYSSSTSKIQCYLRCAVRHRNYVEIDNVPINTIDISKRYRKYLKEQSNAA